MQDRSVYEYAVIRVVPRVERHEFINAGLILFCKKERVLLCRTVLNKKKLACMCGQIDTNIVALNLAAFEEIASGRNNESIIAHLEKPERFRWLTATRSTIIQCSPVHPGLSKKNDLPEVFDRLFEELVM